MNTATDGPTLSMRQILIFFAPLGISSSLITITHLIINSTLARSSDPELIIASYAIALTLLGLIERPAILLRHTCSALVRDRISFKALSKVALIMLSALMLLGLALSYTPLGTWTFLYLFGAEPSMLDDIIDVFRILMFVTLFSGIRCIYHGIIITNFHTKWMTIGVVIRLLVMSILSYYFIKTGPIQSGQVGAIIFLSGMMIECLVSFVEGRNLLRKMPLKREGHAIENKQQIFNFYRPLLYSSFVAIAIGPAINFALGKTMNLTLAIASYSIAMNVTQLMNSFFSYIHQIVLNYHRHDPSIVLRFVLIISLFPAILLSLVNFTPIGAWFLQHIMGISGPLLIETKQVLRICLLISLVFPWLDYSNGRVMLKGQNAILVRSQLANLFVVITSLLLLILLSPSWNGMIGALAISLGFIAELSVVLYFLRVSGRNQI
jgi:O-antigen/teichoic acid export membrane protein